MCSPFRRPQARGRQVTLLDTPGHKDFSEDTYRSLAAADNALMLVDAGKGLEPQVRSWAPLRPADARVFRGAPSCTYVRVLAHPS